ncbi:hypothetical protein C453_01160 [Haloferax elongans ATCC BAA-1513]|uniref:Uncharacterized protein n=1 Tax=Haloferax elongans ATCC BAA-1513 TaxID=1230453 RepID=M0I0B3_HALEO|nr:hypothetical protein [Haloferax elongans]ELZ88829.1 hypothetical protein C453_01160 [Haloferax elongans ATCC BAA-1513]
MSDAVASAGIAADLVRLRGYHTAVRVSYLKADGTTKSPADIDVLGLHRDGDTLAVECQAFGAPTAYPNWNTPRRTSELRTYVAALATNCGQILDPRFEDVTAFDTVWIVFKGFFATAADQGRTGVKASLDAFANELAQGFGVAVRLVPSHRLFQDLVAAVAADMTVRRRRYAGPALELVRHLCAIAIHRPAEIDALADAVMTAVDEQCTHLDARWSAHGFRCGFSGGRWLCCGCLRWSCFCVVVPVVGASVVMAGLAAFYASLDMSLTTALDGEFRRANTAKIASATLDTPVRWSTR